MDNLSKTIGRYLFAIPFLVFGALHLMNLEGMSGLVPGFLPFGQFWVALTGLSLIGASISIMSGIWDYYATFLLGVMLLIFAIFIHLMAVLNGDEMSMPSLLKDLALSGGAWLYSGFIAKSKSFKK